MKRTSFNYFLVSLLFLLIALGVWAFFLLLVHQLNVSTNMLETETAQSYVKKNQLLATEHLAADIATTTQELSAVFASSSQIATVVEAIEKEGTAYSVSTEVRSIATASSSDPALLTLDMDIDATGSWGDLVAFAGSVERMPYAMTLTKASFFTDGTAKSGWSLSAHVTSFLSP